MQRHHTLIIATQAQTKQQPRESSTFQRELISVQTSCIRSGGSILKPASTGQEQQSEQPCYLSKQPAAVRSATPLTKNVATAAHMGLNHQGLPKLALPQFDTGHLPAARDNALASAGCMPPASSHSSRRAALGAASRVFAALSEYAASLLVRTGLTTLTGGMW